MQRTAFSENYPRKFARAVAKIIVNVSTNTKGYQRWNHVLAATDLKRKSSEGNSPARAAKYLKPAAKLIDPHEMTSKRRRLNQKGPDQSENTQVLELSQDIMQLVSNEFPRVGRKEITNTTIKRKIQELFDDKTILRVIACKGTERTLEPPKNLIRGEAPYRRAIIQPRGTSDVKVEDQWESWESLANRQLSRPSHASRVNITVFAANHIDDHASELPPNVSKDSNVPPPEFSSASSQSRTPEEPMHESAGPMTETSDSGQEVVFPHGDTCSQHEKIDVQSRNMDPDFALCHRKSEAFWCAFIRTWATLPARY